MAQTKIICTMGPACRDEATLRAMLEAGMNVARLNFSHGTHEEHADTIRRLRSLADAMGFPLAILQDLSGPKIRIGDIPGGGLTLAPGDPVTLFCGAPPSGGALHGAAAPLPFPDLIKAVSPGRHVLLDDGTIHLEVESCQPEALHCRTLVGGVLTSHKGANFPGVSFAVESLTPRDLEDIKFGVAQGVDWMAQSFVRSPDDIRKLRRLIAAAGGEIPIIAKIEKHEAVDRLDEIISAADGVMVARGDLGVEMRLEEVPLVQKRVIHACNARGKPVITATQMLESMIHNPQPTRAEVTDICNAILDGSDAVMLSAETAAGAYPVASVRMMARVAERTETLLRHREILQARALEGGDSVPAAISEGTVEIAERLGAAAIVCATSSGASARLVSRFRPGCPIVAATTSTRTWNQLALSWGVQPLLMPPASAFDSMLDNAVEAGLAAGLLRHGDLIIVSAGSAIGSAGSTNLIKVHIVGRRDHVGTE